MVKWLGHRTWNLALPSSRPALTISWICSRKSVSCLTPQHLYIANWSAACRLGFLTCWVYFVSFHWSWKAPEKSSLFRSRLSGCHATLPRKGESCVTSRKAAAWGEWKKYTLSFTFTFTFTGLYPPYVPQNSSALGLEKKSSMLNVLLICRSRAHFAWTHHQSSLAITNGDDILGLQEAWELYPEMIHY